MALLSPWHWLVVAVVLTLASPARQQTLRPRSAQEMKLAGERVVTAYADPALAAGGVLDVTKGPYFADPTGKRDSTAALQRAIDDGRDARLVVYFPPGTYRVSDTLRGIQGLVNPRGMGMRLRNDDYPCVLWGSKGSERATVRLAPHSPGFGDPAHPKPVIFLASRAWHPPYDLQPNISFNQMIVSLDVEIGPGNPGAVGIDHQGAQGSLVEDVTVRAGDGFAGFRGASGSGGSMADIRVEGGRYGLCLAAAGELTFSGAQPSPVVSGAVLTGQSEKAVLFIGRGPLTLVGALIEGAGIELRGPGWAPWGGALNLVDCVVRGPMAEPFVTGNRPVYIGGSYFQSVPTVAGLDGCPPLSGTPKGWTHVTEYAAGPGPRYPVWIDGHRSAAPVVHVQLSSPPPPQDFVSRHRWPAPLAPWAGGTAVSVKGAPYGARGDGVTDDTDALQHALDDNAIVWLPKGVYRTSRTLHLSARNRLTGLGVYSVIRPLEDAPAFADAKHPAPVVRTIDSADARTCLEFVELLARVPGAYALDWRAGRGSIVRCVRFKRWPWQRDAAPADHAFVLVEGNGGGRWLNFFEGSSGDQGPDYRHFLARGTRQPLSIYMFNPEHAASDYQTEFADVRNLDIYGVKAETIPLGRVSRPPVYIHGSSHFRIYGHGGIAVPNPGDALYRLVDCTDFLLTNIAPQITKFGPRPERWYVLSDTPADGPTVRTPATEDFTLYQRGEP